MKQAYTQLTEKERQEIARLRLLGWSRRANDRTEPLHFEGDTLGSPQPHRVRLATATCRTTRYTILARVRIAPAPAGAWPWPHACAQSAAVR
jgi:IS30 family transposase